MNRFVFLMSALFMVMLTGCMDGLGNNSAIGVVDTAKVFRDSDAGKEGFKYLEKVQAEMQDNLNALQQELKDNPENKKVAQKLQETYVEFQQRIGAEQQNVITVLNDASQRVLDAYRTKNNILIVISSEATLSFDNTIDITSGIIADLNKEKIEFKFGAANAPASEAIAPKSKEDSAKKKDDSKKEETTKKKDSAKKDAAKSDKKEKSEPKE